MTVLYDPHRLFDANYALGVLCSEFAERFGAESGEIISRVCLERGRALGRKLASSIDEPSFENAVNAFVGASKRGRHPAELVSLEPDRAVVRGTGCPLALEGRGERICRLMMHMDQGILEEASGKPIRFTVRRSLADGDDHCDVCFEIAPTPLAEE